ncbi:LPD25 domain-containing protein [Bacillus sp. SIMBA_074]|uniref:LPD25 domain-containing protein n=1 Tax=Bacillus sp. SIMBA_074 TaxID=3085812 RepID=UPI00397E5B2E
MAYKKKNFTPKTKEQIQEETKEVMDKVLADITKYYTSPEDMLELANFMSKFSDYSPRNMQLIKSQFEHSYACANYKTFKDAGFHVNKGEKAMKVFHPYMKEYVRDPKTKAAIPLKNLTEEQKRQVEKGELKVQTQTTYYLKATAFDISQTNAKPEDLPKIFPNRQFNFEVTEENKDLLKLGIKALAEKENIKIKMMGDRDALIDELGNIHGSYVQTIDGSRSEIVMNTRNTETTELAVSIHELAHAKLHNVKVDHSDHTPTKEFEAELTSYVVCKHYGMDTSEVTVPYIAQWTKNGQDIEEKDKSIMRVHETASSFINTIDQKMSELQREMEKNMEQSKGEIEDVYLVRYGALTSTEEEIVTVHDLRERAGRDKSYNDVENAKSLNDKEYIEEFNKVNKVNCIALNHNEIKKPMVVIQWSEADLETNKAIPFGEANEMMRKRIAEIDIESEKAREKGEFVPYDKTRYHIILPKEMDKDFQRMEVITMDRLDLGDGGYKSPYEQILDEKGYLSDEVKQALQKEISSYNEQTRGQSNPEKLRAVDRTVIGEKQQDKVDHFLSKETERNEDTAVNDTQQDKRRMARMAYMQQMER